MTYAPRETVELASWENEGGTSRQAAAPARRLGWAGFTARFYPGGRRHDYARLKAYERYRNRFIAGQIPGTDAGKSH
jgi:hypothetical protein